jgi:hypothetical protein
MLQQKSKTETGTGLSINIEGGLTGIDLQESLFRIKEKIPKFAYVTDCRKRHG